MGKVTKIEIVFDNPKAEYTAGEVVTGNVVLELSEPVETRGVFIQFCGAAATSDTEINVVFEVSATTRFSRQIYFDCKLYLNGDADTKERHTLDAGEYTFPFRFVVPLECPSTFKGGKGKVQYFCQTEIELRRALDPFDKKKFTVHAVYDLNNFPLARERVVLQLTKNLWNVLGPITAIVRLQHTGFTPGERISINAEITNHSKVAILETKALLKQKMRYQVHTKIVKDENEITKMKRGPIAAGEIGYWNEECLQLPDSLVPTNIGGCDIIELQYVITISVVPKALTRPLKIKIPIVIGTVPFYSESEKQEHPPTFYLPQTSIEATSVANAGFVP